MKKMISRDQLLKIIEEEINSNKDLHVDDKIDTTIRFMRERIFPTMSEDQLILFLTQLKNWINRMFV